MEANKHPFHYLPAMIVGSALVYLLVEKSHNKPDKFWPIGALSVIGSLSGLLFQMQIESAQKEKNLKVK